MKPNLYRQLRLVVMVVAGIGILTTLVALGVAYWSELLQRDFLDSLTKDEYHELLEHLEQHPGAPLPKASQLEIWMDGHPNSDQLPDSLRQLSVGTHHDVALGESTYHVLKTDTDGYPTYVAIEISSFSTRERWLQVALVGVALLDIPLALIMGIWLVRRISIPHEKLARSVSELDPAKGPIHIGKDFLGLEVEQIAKAIDHYQDRLRGFIERERTFTAAASHELRTPVASMLSSAEVLHHDDRLPPELQSYTQNLISTSMKMGEILDGLMWFSREMEKPKVQSVDVEATLSELASEFPDNPIRIDTAGNEGQDRWVELPEGLFSIVITNLLRNACQFSPPASEILVVLKGRRITIKNSGAPIKEDEMALIFQRNYRSAASTGQGLGLYIASSICERLNWTLFMTSGEEGTAVMVEI